VNIAARVAAQASGGQILCTKAIAESLLHATMANVEIEYQGSASLKNLPEPMDPYEIVLTSAARQCVIDPVCKMQVDTRRAARDLQYKGRKYWFCSLSRVERFVEQPSSYAPK